MSGPFFEEIGSFVQEKSQQSWVMAIGETWLNNTVDDGEVGLEGYKVYRKDRRNQRGERVLVYVPELFSCWRRIDLEMEGIAVIWIEIRFQKREVLMCSAYLGLFGQLLKESVECSKWLHRKAKKW